MAKHSKNMMLLEKINNIDEECSDIDEQILSETKDNIEEDDDLFDITEELVSSDTDSEKENISNKRRGRKKKRLLLSSENDIEDQPVVTAADGTVWEKIDEGSKPGRAPIHNIFKDLSGPTRYAKQHIMKGKVKTAFSLIIDDQMMENIRTCTELEACRVLGTTWELNAAKLDAFIALLYARGAYEAKNIDISYLWSKEWGPAFFSRTMSRNVFAEIMRFIRFDKKSERRQRLKDNKFALISETWDRFIENSQSCYKPGAFVTCDEQLFPCKTRCRFTQYMVNKPDKFGLKFWLASDVNTKYIINGFPYLGKDEKRNSSTPLAEFVVLKLMEPFTGCGRNVTTDNFFTSISLATKLLAKKTTIVGTMRRNKRELPELAKQVKDDMTRFSTKLYKSDNITLTVYKSKPNKKVLLLSSMHTSIKIEKSDKCVPETIRFYNSTKYGVDVSDQMAKKYSVKSKSCRWPLQVFFNILDLAGINAWVLYKQVTGEEISRQDFLFQLAVELAAEYRESREKEDKPKTLINISSDSRVRKTCQVRYCKDNKATKICLKCKKYVCGICTSENFIVCRKCNENE